MTDKKCDHISEQAEILPEPSAKVSWDEFIELTSVHPDRLGELIDLGWVDPVLTSEDMHLFRMRDVYRTRKLERLCLDLGVTVLAGTIIVDLLERVDILEGRIRELEHPS